jgi:SAM-dependent methyltransferase
MNTTATTATYIGQELELFRKAYNWKQYYRNIILPYLKGEILEVGAGIGATTEHLVNPDVSSWICLEPDTELAKRIELLISNKSLPSVCKLLIGTTDDLPLSKQYDAIIYMDVIEHIEDDGAELKRAAALLKPGGHLVILVPAHNWLRSPLDDSIGHFRRYNKARLKSVIPDSLNQVRLSYLDSVGLLASLGNKLFLKKTYPNARQIKIWDSAMVPVSKLIDPIMGFNAGKSVLGIWQKKLS